MGTDVCQVEPAAQLHMHYECRGSCMHACCQCPLPAATACRRKQTPVNMPRPSHLLDLTPEGTRLFEGKAAASSPMGCRQPPPHPASTGLDGSCGMLGRLRSAALHARGAEH